MKKLMTGNEAFAYGAYINGVRVGAAYPGTPSSEIMDNFSKYPGVFAEWSPNEKVSLDVAIGAAYSGTRAMCAMKHVGLNVAADSFFYAVYTGIKAGLVIVCADDPDMHSSQNEQDNRNYAKFAKCAMLEPSDSEEAKEFTGIALDMSEQFEAPVLVRSVTRLSHSSSPVEVTETSPPPPPEEPPFYERDAQRYVMVPSNARRRHPVVEERLKKMAEFAETMPINYIEPGDKSLGIVSAGVNYQYAKEVFPNATFLKLGMVYPLPEKLIREFASQVETVIVVEELDPFLEEQLKLMSIEVRGKDIFPMIGEFSPSLVRRCAVDAGLIESPEIPTEINTNLERPIRPPMLCPGCGHRSLFHVLREAGVLITGDIGCYTLGWAPPLSGMHTTGCMGASIGVAHGIDKGGVKDDVVAVLGDSTFLHSGIHPLIDVLYNRGNTTTIISDNSATAMTGFQEHPGTGKTLQNKTTKHVDAEKLVRGIGFEKVDICDPYEIDRMAEILQDHLKSGEPSVIIARHPCVLNAKEKKEPPVVDPEICINCGICLDIGCSPLVQEAEHIRIDTMLCNGCGLCVKVCPQEAIIEQ
ncbi:MAG: indolepyruvate ferredoxin oxidoreductase subunit alpha [Bacillota bacterium]